MRNNNNIAILTIFYFMIVGIVGSYGQTADKKTETFKVFGNCTMCKATIENTLKKKDGITKKEWNTETKMLTVTYVPSKISLKEIKQKIADVGYDTVEIHAKDEAYNTLHSCCKYDRAKK